MKKILVFLLFILIGAVGLYYLKHPIGAKVKVGSTIIPVELAVTEDEKQRGLGYRTNLTTGHGMLFVYDHKEKFNFWMRGMEFPLDFIWIDGGNVVEITTNVPAPKPGEKLTVYSPKKEVNKILELNAGDVQQFGIRVGDQVSFLDR